MENQTHQGYSSQMLQPVPNSTAVLVLGIVSIIGCFCYSVPGLICSIIALVLYSNSIKQYRLMPEAYSEGSLSNLKTGRICAIIGLVLSILYLLLVLLALAFFGTEMLTDPEGFMDKYK